MAPRLYVIGFGVVATTWNLGTALLVPREVFHCRSHGHRHATDVPRLSRRNVLWSSSSSLSSSSSSSPSEPLFVTGPPAETKPDYETIHGPLGKWVDSLFLSIFRTKLSEAMGGIDSKLPKDDYRGLMELTQAMNARYSDKRQLQAISRNTLRSLFPSWLPGSFAVLFAKPFPNFSARMNAVATCWMGTWLMGECEVNNGSTTTTTTMTTDVDGDGTGTGIGQGVLVKRCRFLEESGCASVCVHTCKLPTEAFFNEDMGVPLTMTPDYTTGECQFSFGVSPSASDQKDAMDTPCLAKCPSRGGLRRWHNGDYGDGDEAEAPLETSTAATSQCYLMENDRV